MHCQTKFDALGPVVTVQLHRSSAGTRQFPRKPQTMQQVITNKYEDDAKHQTDSSYSGEIS